MENQEIYEIKTVNIVNQPKKFDRIHMNLLTSTKKNRQIQFFFTSSCFSFGLNLSADILYIY